jgi:crotonobetainyl-CoA:carnitine CoA-transferase CaiB-like acyl-CoA transferase
MSVTGAGDGVPIRSGVSILDLGTGVWMALGVLAALLEKQRSGRGQRVEASLFQTGVMLMAYHLLFRQFAGVNPVPQGSKHTAFAPYGAYQAADGTIMIGISGDAAFRRLCQALGNPQWADDARFRSNPDRVRNTPELDALISGVLGTRPAGQWTEMFDKCDVACDPLQNPEQIMHDRQVVALEQLEEVPLAGVEPALLPRLPITLSETQPAIQGSPPVPGEHTFDVLRESGFAESEISELLRQGICAASKESDVAQS